MPRHALLIAGLLLSPACLLGAENFCDQSETRSTPSPDGKWKANVQEEVCATAGGAAAGITVVLVPDDDAASARRIFIMPVPRSREDWPRIRWLDSRAMEIRVPNLTEAEAPVAVHEGIRVSLVYCGDNPDDRSRLAAYKAAVKQWQKDVSAWAARRRQDEAAAGPRPARPEEPRLSPGRCID